MELWGKFHQTTSIVPTIENLECPNTNLQKKDAPNYNHNATQKLFNPKSNKLLYRSQKKENKQLTLALAIMEIISKELKIPFGSFGLGNYECCFHLLKRGAFLRTKETNVCSHSVLTKLLTVLPNLEMVLTSSVWPSFKQIFLQRLPPKLRLFSGIATRRANSSNESNKKNRNQIVIFFVIFCDSLICLCIVVLSFESKQSTNGFFKHLATNLPFKFLQTFQACSLMVDCMFVVQS